MNSKGFIRKRIKEKMKAYMLITAAAFLLTLLLGYPSRHYILAFFQGTPSFASIGEARELYGSGARYVSVFAEELTPIGYALDKSGKVVTDENSEVASFFWMFYQDSNYFFALLPFSYYENNSPTKNVTLKGILKEESAEVEILELWSEDLTQTFEGSAEELKDMLVGSLYLDATANEDFIFISTVLYLLLLVCEIALFVWHLVRFENPGLHNIFNRFAAYGDKDEIESLLESEMESTCYAKTRNDFVMKSFTLCMSKKFGIYQTRDLVWVYKSELKTPAGKAFCVRLMFDDDRNRLTMRADSSQECEEVVAAISAAVPVIVGYAKDTELMYILKRSEFVALWEKTRDEFNNNIGE